jgi:hypothetical protein
MRPAARIAESQPATTTMNPPSNATFIATHAAPGRIGLCGGRDWINKMIRKAQAPLTADGHGSLWSHAFVFSEQRVDGHWWVIESDLDLCYRQIRLGVQENRVDRYFDADAFPNIAILDFGLDAEQVRQVQVAGLDLLSELSSYSLSELVGTAFAMRSRRLRRRENLLAKKDAVYCSALVQHCYAAAGIEFHAGVDGKNIAPHDIDESALPHQTHRLIRDLGVSTLRELGLEAQTLLRTADPD